MTCRTFAGPHSLSVFVVLLFLFAIPGSLTGEAPPGANSAFDSYAHVVEARLARQHEQRRAFLAGFVEDPDGAPRLRRGELHVEQLTPPAGLILAGALLHHWRGSAFVPGAKALDFERLLREVNAYPQHFSPEVLQAKLVMRDGDRLGMWMRVRQHHVITVVLDTTYDITFGQLDPQHGYSISRSTDITEVGAAGTGAERALGPGQEHGFLWRLNTYWSYEERDGGLYMQVESISLTRSIPRGLGWIIGPFVESVPRESLEFTLRSVCNTLSEQRNSTCAEVPSEPTARSGHKEGKDHES